MTLINQNNLLVYLSGGSTNEDPALSIGGACSGTLVGTALSDLFPNFSLAQAEAGVVLHRCVYFRNEDPNELGLSGTVAYVAVSSPNLWTEVDIGLAPEGLNGTAELLEDAETPPAAVTFSHPTVFWSEEQGYGLELPTPLVEGDEVPVWVRITVTAGAEWPELDYCLLAFVGITTPAEP